MIIIVVEFDMVRTIGLSVILLLLGRMIRKKVKFFQAFAIPDAVIGGFSFAIVNFIFVETGILEIKFDTTLQAFFMVIFFTSVGFGASIDVLKKAGPKVALFLVVAGVLAILQNLVAIGLAEPLGISRGIALMTGSTPMTGGHGTSAGIAPLLEKVGVKGAEVVAYSSATFGLIAGSLMGGPIANYLIKKHNLLKKAKKEEKQVIDEFILEKEHKELDGDKIFLGFAVILISMFFGTYISDGLNTIIARFSSIARLPSYIGPMFIGIILRYISDSTTKFMPNEEIGVIGNVGLNFFLGMALMTLRLWELAKLAGPLIILLVAQTILMALYAFFVTYRLMGKNYDAAVITAGHCGFGMGATPNGVANMEAICSKYVYSNTAFFVLPVVGGMFIDFVNVAVVAIFLMFI